MKGAEDIVSESLQLLPNGDNLMKMLALQCYSVHNVSFTWSCFNDNLKLSIDIVDHRSERLKKGYEVHK